MGAENTERRVLVTYATKTGSTTEVAQVAGEVLEERGFSVDVQPISAHPRVEEYDAVIVGSAVNGGQWLPEAVEFVRSNSSALADVPCAVFCVHIMNSGDSEKPRRKRLAYLDSVREVVTPVDEGFFLGVGPQEGETSRLARWAFKAFGGAGEGDCRDWDAIRAWAREVPLV